MESPVRHLMTDRVPALPAAVLFQSVSMTLVEHHELVTGDELAQHDASVSPSASILATRRVFSALLRYWWTLVCEDLAVHGDRVCQHHLLLCRSNGPPRMQLSRIN